MTTQTSMSTDALPRVHVTADLIEIAKGLQQGTLSRIRITPDMVGATLYSPGRLHVLSGKSGNRTGKLQKRIMTVLGTLRGTGLKAEDILDLMQADLSEVEKVGITDVEEALTELEANSLIIHDRKSGVSTYFAQE